MRREISSASSSLKAAGAPRSELSMTDRHFGLVARRRRVGAGKNHVVHGGGAHGLVRRFAHHPAQRLDQIRFAAAVRTDDAGQAGLDQEVSRFDEGLEADEAQSGELHARAFSRPASAPTLQFVSGPCPKGGSSRGAASAGTMNRHGRKAMAEKAWPSSGPEKARRAADRRELKSFVRPALARNFHVGAGFDAWPRKGHDETDPASRAAPAGALPTSRAPANSPVLNS